MRFDPTAVPSAFRLRRRAIAKPFRAPSHFIVRAGINDLRSEFAGHRRHHSRHRLRRLQPHHLSEFRPDIAALVPALGLGHLRCLYFCDHFSRDRQGARPPGHGNTRCPPGCGQLSAPSSSGMSQVRPLRPDERANARPPMALPDLHTRGIVGRAHPGSLHTAGTCKRPTQATAIIIPLPQSRLLIKAKKAKGLWQLYPLPFRKAAVLMPPEWVAPTVSYFSLFDNVRFINLDT